MTEEHKENKQQDEKPTEKKEGTKIPDPNSFANPITSAADPQGVPANPAACFEEFLREFQARDEQGHPFQKYDMRIRAMAAGSETVLTLDVGDYFQWMPSFFNYLREQTMKAKTELIDALKARMRILTIAPFDPDLSYDVELVDNESQLLIPISQIVAGHVNRLITIQGVAVRSRKAEPKITIAVFECKVCGNIMQVPQGEEMYVELQLPRDCTNPNCQNKRHFEYRSTLSTRIDYQLIGVQEDRNQQETGTMPGSLKVVLLRGLVNRVRPGDHVKVTGVITETFHDEAKNKKTTTIVDTFLLAVGITQCGEHIDEEEISAAEEFQIRGLAADPGISDRITRSISPSIHGMEDIKLAGAVALFGGVQSRRNNEVTRGDIHCLMIGDPGVGKSQILEYMAKLAHRSVKTSGQGASAAGLTAGLVKEKENGPMGLEAGALVLASGFGGVAIIDEFDKMRQHDRSAIHEAMEQQHISISKAGFVGVLPSLTTVIAAANPKNGRYDPYKSVIENINLDPPLLSRFDLILLARDRPDMAQDDAIAEKIFDKYCDDLDTPTLSPSPSLGIPPAPIIPLDLLKKFIYFARKNVFPRLRRDATREIKRFYVQLREAGKLMDTVALTARQLEALVRISQAFARMRLSPFAEVGDAKHAIDLMAQMMKGLGMDPVGGMADIDRINNETTARQRKIRNAIHVWAIRCIDQEPSLGGISFEDLYSGVVQDMPNMTEAECKENLAFLVNEGSLMHQSGEDQYLPIHRGKRKKDLASPPKTDEHQGTDANLDAEPLASEHDKVVW